MPGWSNIDLICFVGFVYAYFNKMGLQRRMVSVVGCSVTILVDYGLTYSRTAQVIRAFNKTCMNAMLGHVGKHRSLFIQVLLPQSADVKTGRCSPNRAY